MRHQRVIKFFIFIILLMSSFTVPSAYAQSNLYANNYQFLSVPKFEQNFQLLMQRWKIPGASIAIMKDDHLIYKQGFGYADRDLGRPVVANALFRIASMSKTITAAAILQLVQAGKISLDSKVFDILNDLQPLPGMRENPAIHEITIRDLLEMSSGWDLHGRGGFDPMFGPWPKYVSNHLNELPADCTETAKLMMGMPMQFHPGTRFAYSNLNYCMLGLVVDKVVGNNYDASTYVNYVEDHILQPLGITDMQIAKTAEPEHAPNEVHYYPYYTQTYAELVHGGLPYSNTQLLEKNYADGGWIASAYDIARFADGLAEHKIIDNNMIAAMTSAPDYIPPKNRKQYFAIAWLIKPQDRLMNWSKTGSFTGSNGFVVKEADNTVYSILFNTRPDEFALKKFRQQFASLIAATHFA